LLLLDGQPDGFSPILGLDDLLLQFIEPLARFNSEVMLCRLPRLEKNLPLMASGETIIWAFWGHLHNHVGLTENFDQSENEEFLVNDSP
jgi:hypothetical protein